MKKVIAILLLMMSFSILAQKKNTVKATDEELKLFAMINEYRKENGLKEIPFSKSLTHVAQTHCKDWQVKKPLKLHDWTSCKFEIGKQETYGCMWYKPQELTTYKGYGYECAHMVFGGHVPAPARILSCGTLLFNTKNILKNYILISFKI